MLLWRVDQECIGERRGGREQGTDWTRGHEETMWRLWRYVSTPPAAESTICTGAENSDTRALAEYYSEGEAA